MLALKEDAKSGDVIITGIDRLHATYTAYRPYRASAMEKGAAAADADEGRRPSLCESSMSSHPPSASGAHTHTHTLHARKLSVFPSWCD